MIRPQKLSLVVEKKEYLTANVVFARLKSETDLEFNSGQFANIMVTKGIQRSYSIASSPFEKNYLDMVVDISPGGIGSKFFESLEVGQSIESIFPLGKFAFVPSTRKKLFVATGTGIAPHRSMYRQIINSNFKEEEIKLIWGMKDESEMYFLEEMKQLSKENSNFKFVYCLSRQSERPAELEGENYFFGRVTDYISSNLNEVGVDVYICGGKEMIADVEKICLDKGVEKSNIYYEQYY